ncbi:MAG: IPT/TIG domain-containing protein, partial [Pyrinomonadaceae bacterium]
MSTGATRELFLTLFVLLLSASYANAQSATYRLHKEASSTSGLFQLKTAGPDGTTLAVQSANLKSLAVGEYLVKAFDTQSGVPNASGVITAGSTITFTLWMNKTAASGVMFPRAKLRLNNATGTLFCTVTGSTALTTTLTKYTFSATTASSISMTTTDRLYVWVGVNVTTVATANTNAALNIEGTLNGNYDSLTVVPTPVPPPAIGSLSTTLGPVGTSVTVTGSNFGATQGTSTVTFNGTAAAPTSWSATSIAVAVPAAATTGPVVVTVNGLASNGVTFTVMPKINSLSPTSGTGGTSVTIGGTTFGATQGTSTVTFNGTTTTPTSWSATSIIAPVPSGATTGGVAVTVNGQTSNAVTFTVITNGTIAGTITRTSDGTSLSGGLVEAL